MRDRPFSRERATRPPGRKVIIACEGGKTEPGYFAEIRVSKHLPRERIVLVPPLGTDPLSVVDAALAEKAALKKARRWFAGDSAWAVFDGDEHFQACPDNWNAARQKALHHEIELAVSNPCFELWLLLHFRQCSTELHRDKARRLLRRWVKAYEKALPIYGSHLKTLTPQAIERARALHERAMRDYGNPFLNPSSGVWRLVELLLSLDH